MPAEKLNIDDISDFLDRLKSQVSSKLSVTKVILFGSFARGDATSVSDIDLAFELKDPAEWAQLVDTIQANARSLRKIDLICLPHVSGNFKDKILNEGIVIFERK